MGKQSRQRIRADKLALQRAQRTRATRPTITVPRVQVPAATYPVIAEADRLVLTEAVQGAVEEATGTDGYQKCLVYALAGWALLGDRGFDIQAGSLCILADPDSPDGCGQILLEASDHGWERGEYHCWIARPTDPPEMVDFAARHFKRFCIDTAELAATFAPEPVTMSFAHTVTGSARDVEWKREDPPDTLWMAGNKASMGERPMALYMARLDTTRSVHEVLFRDLKAGLPSLREVAMLARRNYRALGGTL